MAYKQKGCTPITAKVQKGTKGGITNPLLNVGVPMKASPAKETGYEKKARKQRKTVEQVKKEAGPNVIERFAYNASSEGQAANSVKRKKMLNDKKEAHLNPKKKTAATPTGGFSRNGTGATVKNQKPNVDDLSMTPYSTQTFPSPSGKKGTINGPKVSYDMAYEKAKKTKRYANTSKADYIKEAKRQTKSFKESGDWNATPKKPKAKAVSTIKSEGVKSSKPKVSTGKTPKIKMANKVAEPKTKRENRKQKAIDVKLTKAKAARASGNDRKADRKEKAAKRKADKLANKNSPAKNYKKGYYGK